MKKSQLKNYRELDNRFKLKRYYIVEIKKLNGNMVIPIPDEIIRAYHIKIGDIAVFEIINKNTFIVRFVKNTMYSFVEKLDERWKYETRRSIK